MNDKYDTDNVRLTNMNGDLEEPAATQLIYVQPEEDPNDKARKRMTHNSIEKKRKDKIRYWINKIGELLPPVENSSDKERIGRSTLEIVETAWEYITQLKAQTQINMDMTEDAQRSEIQRLKTELEKTKLEKDRFVDIIRNAGLSTDMTPGLWGQKNASPVLSTININNQDIEAKTKANKSRKRNTISQQLENMKKIQEDGSNVVQMNNQNMLMNQMQMMNNQMMIQNPSFHQTFVQGQGHMIQGQGQMNMQSQNLNCASDKDSLSNDLLQGAMQESGITPSSNPQSGQGEDTSSQSNEHASALQTLASVASQNLISGSTTVVTSQSVSTSNVTQSSSVTTVTTQSIGTNNPIMATGQMVQNNNGLMPFVNGQQNLPTNMFPGQSGFNNPVIQPQQQIVFINEQGIPCIANVPLDPTAMMQNKVMKTEQSIDQAFNQQQQLNIAIQNQLAGMATQNQVNMAGGLMQQQFPMNQQLIPGQLSAAMNQQGLILPVSQAGNLIPVNNMPNQSQLPQALLLPNGQIVPVVTNPQMITGNQNQLLQTNQWRQPQPMTSAPMQIIQPSHSQTGQDMQQSFGLLMTTNSVSSQSSPRSQISMAMQSSSTSSTMSQSTISNLNKTVESSSQENMITKSNTSVDQVMQVPNNMLQQSQNNMLIPASTSHVAQSQKPANTNLVTSQANVPQSVSGTAPILINMVCNGQPTSILVDPVTMQVLGTVQTQQPPTTTAGPAPNAPPQTTPPAGTKKAKKRAICPKPTANGVEETNTEVQTAELKKSTTKSKPKVKKSEQDNTDILAKAAQSIFSSEISPNFYNPANEDNPLQIDTSITEQEEELKRSPQKGVDAAKKSTETVVSQDEVSKLIEDQIKQVEDQNKTETQNIDSNAGDIVTSLLHQEANISDFVKENQSKQNDLLYGEENTTKKGKKNKKSEPEVVKDLDSLSKSKNKKASSSRKGKQQEEVMETKELPEEITFSEKDISSVLDQVEGLGSPPSKKTKSKKVRSETTDVEPLSKKRKHTPTKSKNNEMEKETHAKNAPTSVYDFEEEEIEEDFSMPLFGLNPLRGSSLNSSTVSKVNETKKDTKGSKKSNEKKKPKEVKLDDSIMSPGSDDLHINMDIEKQRDDMSPFNSPTNTEKSSDIVKPNGPASPSSKQETNGANFSVDKRISFPNMEITNSVKTSNEKVEDYNNKNETVLLDNEDIMPLDIATGNVSNDSADIDNTVNSILGFAANTLSPHIVSPKSRNQGPTPTSISSNSIHPVVSSAPSSTVVTSSSSVNKNIPPSQDLSMLLNSNGKETSQINSGKEKEKLDSSVNITNKQNDRFPSYSATESQTLNVQQPDLGKKSDTAKPKSIYSADNFVQSSKNNVITTSVNKYNEKTTTVLSKTTTSSTASYSMPNNRNNNQSNFNERPNTIKYTSSQPTYRDTSPDGFNFASIGLNLSTTAPSGSFIDSLNMSPIMSTCSSNAVTTSTFTFTLSSVKTSITPSQAATSHGPSILPSSHSTSSQSSSYPVYPPSSHHHSPGTSSSKPSYHPMNLSNFDMDLTRNMNRNSAQNQQQQRSNHDRISSMQNQNNVPFSYVGGDVNRESCSLREPPREPVREQAPVFQNITATTPPTANKSQSEQIRNTQKQIQDLSQSRNVPSKSHTDMNRNMSTIERSSTNNMQPFFPSNPLNTPPLHHPPLMSDSNRQNMGVRGSYESSFPGAQTQGYNSSSSQSYRYESNSMPYSSHNSGTQPLSHTPPSSDGRKSANALASNAKQNTNPSSRSMSGPSPGSGPTPPITNRHTPPQAVQPQPTLSKSQRQTGASSSNSKKSKPSQKRAKQPSYDMEGMPPYPYFDPNRMTPFLGLPPQALSPPSRNVHNESHLFSGNFLGQSTRPLSNSAASINKNSELGGPFNSIFPPSRGQNGLGLNFQPGFGMNSMHPSMSNAPSLTPHSGGVTVTPHMSNFSFSTMFPDTTQSDSPINISPIKFHGNQIMDSNSLQHHQGSSLFHPHNRSHHPPLPNAMSINSILGHNHHGFDTRQMSQSMNTSAPPFGSHGHPPTFGMPPF